MGLKSNPFGNNDSYYVEVDRRVLGVGNGFLVVNAKDFERMDTTQREWLIFNTLQHLSADMKMLKTWNRGWAFLGGVIGGSMTILALCGMRVAGLAGWLFGG